MNQPLNQPVPQQRRADLPEGLELTPTIDIEQNYGGSDLVHSSEQDFAVHWNLGRDPAQGYSDPASHDAGLTAGAERQELAVQPEYFGAAPEPGQQMELEPPGAEAAIAASQPGQPPADILEAIEAAKGQTIEQQPAQAADHTQAERPVTEDAAVDWLNGKADEARAEIEALGVDLSEREAVEVDRAVPWETADAAGEKDYAAMLGELRDSGRGELADALDNYWDAQADLQTVKEMAAEQGQEIGQAEQQVGQDITAEAEIEAIAAKLDLAANELQELQEAGQQIDQGQEQQDGQELEQGQDGQDIEQADAVATDDQTQDLDQEQQTGQDQEQAQDGQDIDQGEMVAAADQGQDLDQEQQAGQDQEQAQDGQDIDQGEMVAAADQGQDLDQEQQAGQDQEQAQDGQDIDQGEAVAAADQGQEAEIEESGAMSVAAIEAARETEAEETASTSVADIEAARETEIEESGAMSVADIEAARETEIEASGSISVADIEAGRDEDQKAEQSQESSAAEADQEVTADAGMKM